MNHPYRSENYEAIRKISRERKKVIVVEMVKWKIWNRKG